MENYLVNNQLTMGINWLCCPCLCWHLYLWGESMKVFAVV